MFARTIPAAWSKPSAADKTQTEEHKAYLENILCTEHKVRPRMPDYSRFDVSVHAGSGQPSLPDVKQYEANWLEFKQAYLPPAAQKQRADAERAEERAVAGGSRSSADAPRGAR